MRIKIDDSVIECTIQYGKRKKLLIDIDDMGFITVKAPNDTSEEVIVNAITLNGKLIREKLDQIAKIQERPKAKTYDEHGKFFYLGKEYFIHQLIEAPEVEEEELKNQLKRFYISACKKIVEERIKNYQQQLGAKPKVIEIVESNSKWGSCNSNKKISFNYRLVMAPVEIIDYVVVHELCHLIHMNHDRSFWRRVGSILPDYKEKQEYLNKFGYYMTL